MGVPPHERRGQCLSPRTAPSHCDAAGITYSGVIAIGGCPSGGGETPESVGEFDLMKENRGEFILKSLNQTQGFILKGIIFGEMQFISFVVNL